MRSAVVFSAVLVARALAKRRDVAKQSPNCCEYQNCQEDFCLLCVF